MKSNSFLICERFPKVNFGTSGVRALVADLSPEVLHAYTYGFISHLRLSRRIESKPTVLVGVDLRPSSLSIARTICDALVELGCRPEFLGVLPTPALALRCMSFKLAGIMVTGSHIPFDRNGLKFYTHEGEILKEDEKAISSCRIPVQSIERTQRIQTLPALNQDAALEYIDRNVNYFGPQALAGLKIGLYEHSAAGRDLTKSTLTQLGATVICLGRSEDFVPIDTEAVSEADLEKARRWCSLHQLDALVSTDGDGDRPLVFDEMGGFICGDLLGLLCARELGIQAIAVPLNSNTAIERCGAFIKVARTRIGSPFVIAAMRELMSQSYQSIAGFEANGGFLLGGSVQGLSSLPTRDAMLPILSLLACSSRKRQSISSLLRELPNRRTYSSRISDFSWARSTEVLKRLEVDADWQRRVAGKTMLPSSLVTTDGVRMTFPDGDILHFRASGNAPELRCYAESKDIGSAQELCAIGLANIR